MKLTKSNLRRSRGYGFETWLVKKFIKCGWGSRRLGGASTGLPDVIGVNNEHLRLIVIEAKSTRENSVDIPIDEIQRCGAIQDLLRAYTSWTVIAVRLGPNSKPQYGYYDVYPRMWELIEKGEVKSVRAYSGINKRLQINLKSGACIKHWDEDNMMPWQV